MIITWLDSFQTSLYWISQWLRKFFCLFLPVFLLLLTQRCAGIQEEVQQEKKPYTYLRYIKQTKNRRKKPLRPVHTHIFWLIFLMSRMFFFSYYSFFGGVYEARLEIEGTKNWLRFSPSITAHCKGDDIFWRFLRMVLITRDQSGFLLLFLLLPLPLPLLLLLPFFLQLIIYRRFNP